MQIWAAEANIRIPGMKRDFLVILVPLKITKREKKVFVPETAN